MPALARSRGTELLGGFAVVVVVAVDAFVVVIPMWVLLFELAYPL